MAGELRVDTIKNTSGLGLIIVNTSGIVVTGIITDTTGGYLSTPPGTIITVAASTAPAGYLKANGASLSTTTYASLFSTIAYTFGGSGASFTIPDLRGEFIRGWADDRTDADAGRTFGIPQTDAMQGHYHEFFSTNALGATTAGVREGWNNTSSYERDISGRGGIRSPITDGVNGTPRTASETRPRNVALLACIKY